MGRLIVAIVLLVAVLPVDAQMAGEMVSVLGKAEVLREGRWQALNTGGALKAGEVVQTGEGSRIAIQFANGPQLKLNANSRLELKAVEGLAPASTSAAQIILRLITGEMRVKGNGDPLEVQTLPATAIIRGTEYNLAVGPPDSARLAVLAGLVEFANPQGSVLVAANEQATVKLGEAPRKTVLLNPLDAVQWSLYYPDLDAGQPEPDRIGRADPRSPRHLTEAARDYLLCGQVPDARQALDRALMLDPNDARAYSLRAVIELVQNRKAEARADADRAVAADPEAPEAHLALSWVQQAEFDLDGALASARRAVELAPDDPHALIQESRLLFGLGRVKEAFKVAEKARQRAPKDALVNSTWGFLQLARNHVDEADRAFREAIAQDTTLGEPHLGLGLALFRRNRTDVAVEEMRKATLLEPSVSLYNSYLGKAYYEVKQDRQAEKYLALAKQLDPLDPTPHFYDAIRRQSVNQPVEAVRDLQKSIELNDNRAVYRSRLLLDEDLAARGATLGRIYNEVGFEQLGLREGWRSLGSDPADYSAHRLLADSYLAFSNYEAARVSELLQSQLLQPINIAPVQPQMAETRLMMPSQGPTTPSLYEYNPLLVRDRPTIFASALGGNQNAWGDDLIISGLTDRIAYSLGQFHYQSDGYRKNNDLKNDIYDLFAQISVTPDLTLQAEYRYRETTQGDLRSNFYGTFRRSERRSISQDMARVGMRYSLSSQTNVIASLIYADRDDDLTYSNKIFNRGLTRKGYQAEAQMLYKGNDINLITGLRIYGLDDFFSGFQQVRDTISNQEIVYSYANIKFPENLIWTLGLSYESNEHPSSDLNELSPKFGVQWEVNNNISLRAAAFKIVKRSFAVDQTIEPTQVAGFNQFFDNFAMTVSENYGIGLNVRFNDRLLGGLDVLRRDLEIPIGIKEDKENFELERAREDRYNAYLYWLPSRDWAISASYLYEGFEVKEGILGQLDFSTPARMRTISIPLNVSYFDPSGFFAGLGVTYVNQHVQSLDRNSEIWPPPILPTESDDFVLMDASFGYRLPNRWGILALEIRNIMDKKFHFQDYSFLSSDDGVNPRFIPERNVFARFALSF